MADSTTTEVDADAPAADGGDGDGREFTAPKDQAEFDRMIGHRLAAERKKFADYDDIKAKAAKFDELDAATKSDTEKLNERATSAETRATKAEGDALRWEIALDKGLTKTQAKRLVGTTREELEADADELLKDLGTDGARRPRPDPSQGRESTSKEDPDAWLREQARK